MKKLKLILVLVAFIFAANIHGHSQSVNKIVKKATKAMGGKGIISSITSMYLENSVEVMGNESPSTTIILNGKGAKTKSEVNGETFVNCYTDKGGWSINPMMEMTKPVEMSDEQYSAGKHRINIEESFVNYKDKGNKVELLGKEKLQDKNVYKIKVTTSDNQSVIYFIDNKNYYIVQIIRTFEMMGQETDIITKLSDYKKTDFGYVLPGTTNVNFGDRFSMDIKLKKAEFNIPVDTTIFDLGNLD